MAEGMLTQEEIDALLSGTAFEEPMATPAGGATQAAGTVLGGGTGLGGASGGRDLQSAELKGLGERLKTGLASAADVTATLLGRKLILAPISIDMVDEDELGALIPQDGVAFDFAFQGDVSGPACIVLSSPEALLIAGIMMGTEGEAAGELDELHESAVKEGIKHFTGGLASALARDSMSDIKVGDVELRTNLGAMVPLAGAGKRVLAQYSLQVEGSGEGSMYLVLDVDSGRRLSGVKVETEQVTAGRTRLSAPTPSGGGGKAVGIQQVQFPMLQPTLSDEQTKNIEILLDVSMSITVELGRTSMMIKDVLELGTGSIIELDKLAGEPVDLLVNNKLIARGEVVVIDENFGVRVTDIITPAERLKGLQS